MLNAQKCRPVECSAAGPTTITTNRLECVCHRLHDTIPSSTYISIADAKRPRTLTKWHQQYLVQHLSMFTFLHLILLMLLLALNSALAVPQPQPQSSCILCDKNDLLAKEPTNKAAYEEFLFDHQVSRQDAIHALRKFNETYATKNSCNSIKCTDTVLKYCLGPQFINDHCWCELRHSEEGLPYVPHICYVGEKVYKPSVGSCFFFEEVKECCCAAALAKEWRHISGAGKPKMFLSAVLLYATPCLLRWHW